MVWLWNFVTFSFYLLAKFLQNLMVADVIMFFREFELRPKLNLVYSGFPEYVCSYEIDPSEIRNFIWPELTTC